MMTSCLIMGTWMAILSRHPTFHLILDRLTSILAVVAQVSSIQGRLAERLAVLHLLAVLAGLDRLAQEAGLMGTMEFIRTLLDRYKDRLKVNLLLIPVPPTYHPTIILPTHLRVERLWRQTRHKLDNLLLTEDKDLEAGRSAKKLKRSSVTYFSVFLAWTPSSVGEDLFANSSLGILSCDMLWDILGKIRHVPLSRFWNIFPPIVSSSSRITLHRRMSPTHPDNSLTVRSSTANVERLMSNRSVKLINERRNSETGTRRRHQHQLMKPLKLILWRNMFNNGKNNSLINTCEDKIISF